jgi:hypothetical protein
MYYSNTKDSSLRPGLESESLSLSPKDKKDEYHDLIIIR